MKSDSTTSIIQNNNINNFPMVLPSFVKAIIFSILLVLTINEMFNFILLRGFENPLGYCLFKLIVYSFSILLLKYSDNSMTYILTNLKALNEEMVKKLEEIRIAQTRAIEEDKE